MRFSVRLKVVSALAVLILLFVGCAWAGENEVETAIASYGLSRKNSETGSIITVVGSVNKDANEALNLGDIGALTIDWKANLTVTTDWNKPNSPTKMITFTNGNFKLTGGEIKLPTLSDPNSNSQWFDAIYASGNAIVTVDGGKVTGNRATDTGINVGNGTLVINSGEINIPKGNAVFAGDLQINDTNAITGVAFEIDGDNVTARAYGNTTSVTDSEVFLDKYDDDDEVPDSISYIAGNGSVWNIEGVQSDMRGINPLKSVSITVENGGVMNFKNTNLEFQGAFNVEQGGKLNIGLTNGDTSRLTHNKGTAINDGTINIYGTLTNLDKVMNNDTGIINNYSGNTLDNQGTLANNGVIYNASTGKMKNTGNIDNANGEIDNTEGGVFQSVQTAEEMGGDIEGPVEPINSGGGSSGGGCNAGFGMFGLLLTVVFVMRKYLIA
jgi:hypothetical protein